MSVLLSWRFFTVFPVSPSCIAWCWRDTWWVSRLVPVGFDWGVSCWSLRVLIDLSGLSMNGTPYGIPSIRHNEEHGTTISIHQVKYLNNILEQDHRGVTRVTRPCWGSNRSTQPRHTIKRRQMRMEAGEEGLTAAAQFYSLVA